MSSKTTILLSDANEHWYSDCSENDDITLEFDKEHLLFKYNDKFEITIKKGSALYKALKEIIIK